MLIPVILAGGVGTRLWPLSRRECPKQFVKLLDSEHTLFQETLLRIYAAPTLQAAAPIVVCNADHLNLVRQQLAEIKINQAKIILEPLGRNTAPAVAVAALLAQQLALLQPEHGADATLLVLAADHAIADEQHLHEALALAERCAADDYLVCFGVKPTRPETGYGYMKVGTELDKTSAVAGDACAAANISGSNTHSLRGFSVECFVEKPDRVRAAAYLQAGNYYWNSGMFMFRAAHYLQELQAHAGDIFAACSGVFERSPIEDGILKLESAGFAACRSDSIDYAVMERTQRAAMVTLDAGWSDVGSWFALWEAGVKDVAGNVVAGTGAGNTVLKECSGSYIHTTGKRKVIVVGTTDYIVVDTETVLLVLPKERHQEVKQIAEELS
jgi:mannose-1-phosphate guanylyltransferase